MSERNNGSRYTERTSGSSASKASISSKTSGASISSEQRSREFQEKKDKRDRGEVDEYTPSVAPNSAHRSERPSSRRPSSKAPTSTAPSKAPTTIAPSESISVRPPPRSQAKSRPRSRSRESDKKPPSKTSSRTSSVASSATVKPSRQAPSIGSNLFTLPEDRTVIADSENGGRRTANPSQVGTNYSQDSRNLSNTYNPKASRGPPPSKFSKMTKEEIATYLPDESELREIRGRHKAKGSVAESAFDLAEKKAGRRLGNTLLMDGDGTPIGVAKMSLDPKYGNSGGLFELNRVGEGDPRLSDRTRRREESPDRRSHHGSKTTVSAGGSLTSDTNSNFGRRTVVPHGYEFSDRASSISGQSSQSGRRTEIVAPSTVVSRSTSGRQTVVPHGYEFSDRASDVSGQSSQYQTKIVAPTSVTHRPKYKTKKFKPDSSRG
ncbi:hypothetical protein SBOR_8802 [Sclerotinia borealis F-4128]|uniref:Uncharacterized protein n=1 Tax=Sclerotinia borealis (strain F-4128) TaxID=1432307 RepID=W9C4P4_SCLBF|nr:hypothetical protein SBOR_8802 [Sclerotinia borealis F-4128]